MRLTAALRLAAVSAVALALSACFTSQRELIGYWGADTPLQEGVYAHWPTHPDGTEWDFETWRGRVEADRRRYVSQTPNFPHEGARLREISANIYLAQLPSEDGFRYGVAWVYEDGAVISYHQPDCSALADAIREEAGVVLDPEGYCRVEDLDQIERLMGHYLDVMGQDIVVHGVYRRVE
ncbi:hypothetical protein ACWCOP_09980 [Maricaulaceae bacterium MS644]